MANKKRSSYIRVKDRVPPKFFNLGHNGTSVDYYSDEPKYKRAAKVAPHFSDIATNSPAQGSTTDKSFTRAAARNSFSRTEKAAPKFFALGLNGSSTEYVSQYPKYKKAKAETPRFETLSNNSNIFGTTTEKQKKLVRRNERVEMPSFIEMADKQEQKIDAALNKKNAKLSRKVFKKTIEDEVNGTANGSQSVGRKEAERTAFDKIKLIGW